MVRQLRSEFLKATTTGTVRGMFAALVVLVALGILVHTYALPVDALSTADGQRGLLTDVAVNLGGLFAALLGALWVTAEYRTGTIRPTFLVAPRRLPVILAKAAVGAGFGALAVVLSVGTAVLCAWLMLATRDIDLAMTGGEYLRLFGGGMVSGAFLGVIGLAVGAILRAQVPAFVALFTWLLFVENVLVELPGTHRLLPGALGQALAGQDREGVLAAGWLAVLLLAAYAAVALAGSLALISRRDVA